MARPVKQGLEYFTVDTDWERKMKLFQAKFKAEGVGVIIILWQWIYNEGYFIHWDDETKLMFANNNHIEEEKLDSMIEFAIEKEIFNKKIFNKYSILTSRGIQKRYFNGCLKRTEVHFHKNLLLFDPIIPDWSKTKLILNKNESFLISKNPQSESGTPKKKSKTSQKDSRSTQRRERRESKGEKVLERRESKGNSAPPPPSASEAHSPPSQNHQSRDGPLETDQFDSEGKRVFSAEKRQKEKDRQKAEMRKRYPEAFKEEEIPPF